MDIKLDRKISVNTWIIRARWLYLVGILAIGFMTKQMSETNVHFSHAAMMMVFSFVFVANIYLLLFLKWAKKIETDIGMDLIGYVQIGLEVFTLTIVLHFAGGVESVALVFFFLPIVSSSIIFGLRGAITTALISAFLVNSLVYLEYYGWVEHITRYSENTIEFNNLAIGLTKSFTISFFYIIIAFFAGYGSKLLYDRERLLEDQTNELLKQKEYRENELRQLDKTTKLVVKRDLELTNINDKLDDKLMDLKRSEKSMLKAFLDLKREREKVEEGRNKIAAIIANFIDPIIVVDKNSRIGLLNPAAREIFGLSDKDLEKKIPGDRKYAMTNFSGIINKKYTVKSGAELKTGNPNEEEMVIDNDGQELTYKVTTAEVTDNNKHYLGTMKIFYNLTREKMIDKLKSEFISIAAHQLRTPLSAIKWVIKMVLDGDVGKLNHEQEKLLLKGYSSNERIIQLVNDMLNISRIEEGRFGYNFKRDNILTAVNIVVDTLEPRINEKNIKFSIDKPKSLPDIYMDRQRMVLVIQNLIENAVKYTPEHGKICVSIELSDKLIKIKVKDNGVGIPKADQAKLFTKFFRAENVVRMQTEGSGLGLFMVRNIVKKHGGDINFSSEEGKGSEFVFTLPIV